MKLLYKLYAIAYVFVILTSYAINDLFGVNRGIVAFISIFFTLYLLDIIVERYLHRKSQSYTMTQNDRLKLSLFAGLIWTILEIVFIAVDAMIHAYPYFKENPFFIFNPMFFVSGFLIGIAVWGSLGYGLSKNKDNNR